MLKEISKEASGAGVEQRREGQAVRSRGGGSWLPLGVCVPESRTLLYSKGILEARVGKPGKSEIHLEGSLMGRGRQSPPGEGQEANGRDSGDLPSPS